MNNETVDITADDVEAMIQALVYYATGYDNTKVAKDTLSYVLKTDYSKIVGEDGKKEIQ